MNIVERGKAFLERLRELGERKASDWRECPHCGSTWTIKYGFYNRWPWFFAGRRRVSVQRHLCHECSRTYSEESPLLVRGSWYAREVHRAAIDHWQHMGTSLRRTAEMLRSWLGHQERWLQWRPLDEPRTERCHLGASTVHRWLDKAGEVAERSVRGQLAGVEGGRVLSTDGLWAKLKKGAKRVVLLLVDSVSGLMYPPLVAEGERSVEPWRALFARATEAGLDLAEIRGVTSDGAQGLLAYVSRGLTWAYQQRCVWHLWRNLRSEFSTAARAAAKGLNGEAAKNVQKRVRDELQELVHQVMDATSYDQAEAALAKLMAHPQGASIGQRLNQQFDHILAHLLDRCQGLQRVGPEWCWRDFRLRLSRGRNHGSRQRLQRAASVWTIYSDFEPAQWRSERKRHYRYPGRSALEVAGLSPGSVSYLDALEV